MLPRTVCRPVGLASSSRIPITCIISAVVLLLAAPPVSAGTLQDGWVSLDGTMTPTPPSVEVMFSSSSEVVLRVTTHGVLCETVTEDTLEFHRISTPGCYHSPDVGYACVPLIGQLIAVPEGAEIDVSVAVPDSADTVYFSDAAVYPTPALVVEYTPEGWEYLVEEFALEEGYYDTGYYPGEVASVGGEGSLRGQGVARVTVYPLQFDGSTSELVAYPELLVTITWSGGRGGLGEPTGPLSHVAGLVLPNYEGGDRGGTSRTGAGEWNICHSVAECAALGADYLMIVDGALVDSVHILADHRSAWNGYNVAVVSDTTVIENADTLAISDRVVRRFIRDVYETESAAHMADGRLGYVLLVGDAESDSPNSRIPAHDDPVTTDHWYACVKGDDEYADVMLGRLAASHLSEFVTEASKIRYYEVNAADAMEWRHNALLACGFCYATDEDLAESAHDAFGDVAPPGYTVDEIHAHEQSGEDCQAQYDATQDTIVAWVERTGYHLIELCSHGYPAGTYAFDWWDADTLSNGDTLGFWMAYSCETGAFDYVPVQPDTFTRDCLGERLLHRNGMNGAIGFFGSTEVVERSWEYLGRYMWEAFFDWDMYTPGEAIAYAKLSNLGGAGYAFDHLRYNLLGDPAIDLFLTDSAGYGTYPDYVVRSSEMSATPGLPSCGDEVLLHARVRNVSNCSPPGPVAVLFEMCEQDGTECVPIGADSVIVPAWGSRVVEVPWTVASGDVGHRAFRAVVDPESLQAELHDSNNDAMIDVGVLPNKAGFPVRLGGTGGLSPIVVDVDSDADPEIVAVSRNPGIVKALSSSGTAEWTFGPSGGQELRGPVACGDLDSNGAQEVVVCRGDTVTALAGSGGTRLWRGRPYGTGLDSGAVLADIMDGDGTPEVLVTRSWGKSTASHEQVAVEGNGSGISVLWRGPVLDGSVAAPVTPLDKSSAAADLDGDRLCDVLSSHFEDASPSNGYWVTAYAGTDGDSLWSRYLGGPRVGVNVLSCDPVLADVSPDSAGLEVLCGVRSAKCYSHGGSEIWDVSLSGYLGGLAVSRLDDEDGPEIVAVTYGSAGDPEDCEGRLYVLSADGDTLDSTVLDYAAKAAPVISDLDGDGQQEVLVTSSCYEAVAEDSLAWVSHLDAFTVGGTGQLTWFTGLPRPLLFWGELTSSPCVADVDEDGELDIVIVDGDGLAHCLESSLWNGGGSLLGWECYQRDERHTGVYEVPVTDTLSPGDTLLWSWGNYLMTGDVTVPSSSRLEIRPGVAVRAVPGADDQCSGVDTLLVEFIIHGDLEARGAPDHEILLTSASSSPSSVDWRGIRLREGSRSAIDDVTISYAEQAIDAYKPDALSVRDSDVLWSDIRGIKCKGNPGVTDSVVVHNNTVEGGIIGIELDSCAAMVGSNTIAGCSDYGMKIYQDRGSEVLGNVVTRLSYGSGAFSGIYVNGSRDSLLIAGNAIGDDDFAPSAGIEYELSYSTDACAIEDNVLRASDDLSCVKGMYFYDAKPTVRRNSLEGEEYYAAFWVAGDGGMRPNLGTAVGGECPATCMDDTPSGCNRVVPQGITWCVKVEPGSSNTVMAECNWWGEAYGLFSSVVDHSPSLDGDPWERGGEAGEQEPDGPVEATLLQNVPNPFNPETVFRFGLPEAGQARLDIYSLAGRHVRTLVDGLVGAGWQTVTWDGRGQRGERVASGVYFCRFEAGNVSESRKVVILK